jgi:hypothetical protein
MLSKQRGLSFAGFVIGAFLLVLFGIFALKLIPAYMQNMAVERIFVAIANDPEMQEANQADIRTAFAKRASIDNVNAVRADDIRIAHAGGMLVLSANYDLKIPLAGNVSLYLEFNPTSAEQE